MNDAWKRQSDPTSQSTAYDRKQAFRRNSERARRESIPHRSVVTVRTGTLPVPSRLEIF